MTSSAQIRQQFLDFFVQKHGHTFVPSSPVVPHDDPTLLFTNAGMNQFKSIFLGQEKRPYTRAANTQKCIRAGGKHNDLDDVGRSRRHGTFFEMLGNWSFGDYFKQGAIEMSWELLTQVFGLDPTRIHVTCFIGDPENGIPRDDEAAQIWRKVANWEQFGCKSEDHIHFLKENFWEMGDVGPCGPCTEIFIDRTPEKTGGPSVVKGDDPRVMEFWNDVFIQYNRDAAGKLTPLPAQHVDTGMGFERICSILQDKADMYGIDLFDPFFAAIADLCGFTYGGQFPKSNAPDPVAEANNVQLRRDIAFRVIADHLRTLTFALTDGAIPSNEGRGYVLRRILRRAVRFGRQQLGLAEPFMHKLVPVVVESMGGAFPELKKNPQSVSEIIRDEETSFGRTLDRGIQLFEEAAGQGSISAADAFKLHDTYGFPIDLTRIMAEERAMSVDIAGYEKLMDQARQRARAGGKSEDSRLVDLAPNAIAQLQQAGVKPTNDQPKFSHEPVEAKVMAIWNGDDLGLSPANVYEDEELAIILDHTNFYAEMGGQVGDSGEIYLLTPSPGTPGEGGGEGRAAVFDVETTKNVAGFVLHIGRLRTGALRVGDPVQAVVSPIRPRTEQNHTSTHLANWALREVLGEAVQQKGSLVDPEKLRFDFSHPKAMSDAEVARVEEIVNAGIAKKMPVYAEEAPQELALKIDGLRAVFGEKYPPMVRVVSIGAAIKDLLADPANPKWRQFSVEFCGGTHLKSTGQAGAFVITSEESVSKGIRRIVALTGDAGKAAAEAGAHLELLIQKSNAAADAELTPLIESLNQSVSSAHLPLRSKRRAQAAIAQLQSRHKTFEKTSRPRSGSDVDAVSAAGRLLAEAVEVNGAKLIVGEIAGATEEQLRSAVDSLRKRSPSHAIMVASSDGQKANFVAAVSDDMVAKGLKAGEWVKQAAAVAGGGGGGRPQMAQGSGKDPAKIPDALEAARQFARSR